ncbi:hypothetical protein GUU_02461 [Malacoplasma iowae 695]|nr:hypothetical protein GUU_02461 [Malacoplasma iowae 695]
MDIKNTNFMLKTYKILLLLKYIYMFLKKGVLSYKREHIK